MAHLKPTKTSQSRVFLISGRARPDHVPTYESCTRMMGIARGFGDIEKIECPDPYAYGKFVDVGFTRGATERVTTSLEARYMLDTISTLLKSSNTGCAMDVQLHMGQCQDPSQFNQFEKALILESAYITNYSTEDLGALASGDDAVINETVDISAENFYEVMPIGYGEKAGALATNEVLDVIICDTQSCGDCVGESDGCQKIFAITKAAGGSASTPSDIIYSIDGGTTWYAHDIDSLGVAEDPSAIACVGDYLVVVSNASNSLHYALKSEFDGTTDPTWTEVTTGFVTGYEPNDIWSDGRVAFIAADGGYVYYTDDPLSGVTVLEAGTLTTSTLTRIHGLNDEFVVAVGENGVVMYTDNGTTFSLATTFPVGFGVHLRALWVKAEAEWFVGSSAGNLYYTNNTGLTWTVKAFTGSGAGVVWDIVMPTASIAFLSHATALPRGRILRSFDGGQSWELTPEKAGTIPAGDRFNRLGYCTYDPNVVVGVGLADGGADGFIVLGTA